eukprot:5191919-Pyramimonas_sp.AAC.3
MNSRAWNPCVHSWVAQPPVPQRSSWTLSDALPLQHPPLVSSALAELDRAQLSKLAVPGARHVPSFLRVQVGGLAALGPVGRLPAGRVL